MNKFAAFLRGVNLGKRQVKSDELKRIFADAGFTNVQTVVASGNVVFESKEKDEKKLQIKIEKALKDALGFDVIVFLRSGKELRRIVDENPFKGSAKGTCYINFLSEQPNSKAVKEIEARANGNEMLKIAGREFYMLFQVNMSESVFFKKNDHEKVLGVIATNRKITTISKMLDKLGSLSEKLIRGSM